MVVFTSSTKSPLMLVRIENGQRIAIGPVEEPVGAVGNVLGDRRCRFAPGLQQFALGDEAGIEHAVEHGVGAGLRHREILMRRIFRRRLEQARQHRRFGQRDVAHRLAEIKLRSRLDAIVAAAKIGAVEIELEDFLLAQPRLDPQRQEGLMHLAADGALGREEQVLGHLLGERRTALHHIIGPGVLHDGAERADDIDAEMLEEARILGGQHRLDHGGRNFLKRNGVVLADAAAADDLAIGIGEGHGIFAAAVPHIAGAGEGRQRIGQHDETGNDAEGDAVIEKIDDEALQPPDAEPLEETRIGRARSA